jgi:myo-inositol catabolism protein IolC
MTTFTTEDRLTAAGVFHPDDQLQILSKIVNEQYNQVKDVLNKTKEKPLDLIQIIEISKQYQDRYEFARAIEKAHHIGE